MGLVKKLRPRSAHIWLSRNYSCPQLIFSWGITGAICSNGSSTRHSQNNLGGGSNPDIDLEHCELASCPTNPSQYSKSHINLRIKANFLRELI